LSANSETPPRLGLAAKDAAKAVGIGVRLLWELTNKRQIPHLRINRRVVYPVDLLRQWMAEQAEGGKR